MTYKFHVPFCGRFMQVTHFVIGEEGKCIRRSAAWTLGYSLMSAQQFFVHRAARAEDSGHACQTGEHIPIAHTAAPGSTLSALQAGALVGTYIHLRHRQYCFREYEGARPRTRVLP
jgi:hypothetical protein